VPTYDLLVTVVIPTAIFLVIMLVLIVPALVWQRKGLSKQEQAMSHIEESLDLSRRNVQLQEQANALTEELIRGQQQLLQLLRELTRQPGAGPSGLPLDRELAARAVAEARRGT
jgi:ABC-type branched-subunit amino acid transport system ATPase component